MCPCRQACMLRVHTFTHTCMCAVVCTLYIDTCVTHHPHIHAHVYMNVYHRHVHTCMSIADIHVCNIHTNTHTYPHIYNMHAHTCTLSTHMYVYALPVLYTCLYICIYICPPSVSMCMPNTCTYKICTMLTNLIHGHPTQVYVCSFVYTSGFINRDGPTPPSSDLILI